MVMSAIAKPDKYFVPIMNLSPSAARFIGAVCTDIEIPYRGIAGRGKVKALSCADCTALIFKFVVIIL
jgi:hypothetical protein